MTKILSAWIIIQLLFIGMAQGEIYYEWKHRNTIPFQCSQSQATKKEWKIFGMFFPLAFYVPESDTHRAIDEYCKK